VNFFQLTKKIVYLYIGLPAVVTGYRLAAVNNNNNNNNNNVGGYSFCFYIIQRYRTIYTNIKYFIYVECRTAMDPTHDL